MKKFHLPSWCWKHPDILFPVVRRIGLTLVDFFSSPPCFLFILLEFCDECQNIKVFCHLFFLSNLIIIILTVIYFILYIFQFHSHYLVSFNFYIKFSLYSFGCFFFIFLVIELYFQFHHSIFDFNFFMLNLVPIFFHCYLFGFGYFFNWFFFLIQSLSILLIENFVSLFFRVCLLWV
jgi:hypothetical protein